MTLADRFCRGTCFGLVLLCIFVVNTGCRSSRPAAVVELRATDDSRRMEQRFSKAYFSRDAGGDYDFVLFEQVNPSGKGSKRGTIDNIDAPPLTQVLHIKVLWRAKTMFRGDAPSATNCTLRYTVLAGDDSGAVTYDGVGFANVYGSDAQVRVILSNASLKPSGKRGTLEDPIGQSTLETDFKAKHDSTAVKDILSMARDAGITDRTNPPPRPPTP